METQEILTPGIALKHIASLRKVSAGIFPVTLDDHQEQDRVYAGWGSCKSCDCSGYTSKKPDICECGHHFSRHQ